MANNGMILLLIGHQEKENQYMTVFMFIFMEKGPKYRVGESKVYLV